MRGTYLAIIFTCVISLQDVAKIAEGLNNWALADLDMCQQYTFSQEPTKCRPSVGTMLMYHMLAMHLDKAINECDEKNGDN